jgi:hypothetical protein
MFFNNEDVLGLVELLAQRVSTPTWAISKKDREAARHGEIARK